MFPKWHENESKQITIMIGDIQVACEFKNQDVRGYRKIYQGRWWKRKSMLATLKF